MRAPWTMRLVERRRWPDTVYASVEPEAPAIALQADLAAAFPSLPIYGGAIDVFVPHVTIAEGAVRRRSRGRRGPGLGRPAGDVRRQRGRADRRGARRAMGRRAPVPDAGLTAGAQGVDRRPRGSSPALGEQHQRVVDEVGRPRRRAAPGSRPRPRPRPRPPRRSWPRAGPRSPPRSTLRPAASTPPSSSVDRVRAVRAASAARSRDRRPQRLEPGEALRPAARRPRRRRRSTSGCPGGRSGRPARRRAAARRRRSRARATGAAGRCPTSRPCATAGRATGSGSGPRRSPSVAASASASSQPTISTRPSRDVLDDAGDQAVGAPARPCRVEAGVERRRAPACARSCRGPCRDRPHRQPGRGHRRLDLGDRDLAPVEDRRRRARRRRRPRGPPRRSRPGPTAPPEAMTGTSTRLGDRAQQRRCRSPTSSRRGRSRSRAARRPRARRPARPSRPRRGPADSRPPLTTTSKPDGSAASAATARASIATTTAWLPNRAAHAVTSAGSATARVLRLTLSAPARSTSRISSTLRTPPPTVSGTNARRAVRSTMSRSVAAALGRGGDVEEHELVGALAGVPLGELGRVALVDEVDEAGALDDAAVRDVEARDHAAAEHQAAARARAASADDVRDQPQAVGARPLRVELDAEQAAARDGGHERAAVLGRGERSASASPPARRARRTSGRSRSPRRRRCRRTPGASRRPVDLVPADVRQRRGVLEADRAPGQHAERLGAVLVAALEQELEPEADAEERAVGGDPGADRVDEAGRPAAGPSRAPPPRRRARRGGRRRRSSSGVGRATDACAGGEQRLLDRDEVAGAVVDDRDVGRPRGAPLTPASPSSTRRRSAAGRARTRRAARAPSALNAASARWWSLRPVPLTWTVAPAVRANDSSACSTSWSGSVAGALAAEREVDHGVRPPADVDDRRRERPRPSAPSCRRSGGSRPGRRAPPRTPPRARARRPRRCGARRRGGRRSPRSRGRTGRGGRASPSRWS